MNIKHSFPVYELLNKYGFSEGSRILPEEKPLVIAACHKLADAIGVVGNRWKPVVVLKSPCYVGFDDLADTTGNTFVRFYNMPEREVRKIQERLDALGWYDVSVDDACTRSPAIKETDCKIEDVKQAPDSHPRPLDQPAPALKDTHFLF
jgi:hypothetical protein